MAASFPGSVKSFGLDRVDGEYIPADDMNDVRAEIVALETYLRGQILASTYTPVLTIGTNVTSIAAANICHYLRIGDHVLVAGLISGVTPTAAGGASFGVSFPIASTLGNQNRAAGSGSVVTGLGIRILGDATNNRFIFAFTAASTAAIAITFTAMYQII